MAALGNVSVTSAAIIEGSLIIGLSDGSIINCGYVQGPQGLKGDRGPTGATGERGTDGATIHTIKGPPPADLGKEGDYAINNRDWFIFGPKASGMWGAGQGMLPKDINQPVFGGSSNQGGGPIGGSDGGGGGGGPSGPVFTSQVIATGSGRLKPNSRGTKVTVNYPGSANGIISPSGDMNFQSNINGWIVDALDELEGAIPVPVVDALPSTGQYDGQLVLFEGSLYIWADSAWTKVSADGGAVIDTIPPMPAEEGQLWFNNNEDELTLYIYDGADWVPAAPPVSLDGIESSLFDLSKEISEVNNRVTSVNLELEQEVAYKAGDRADNLFEGNNEFLEPVVVAPGTKGNEAITYEQLANLAGEIDEIKDEKEKGEWKAEIPSTGSEGGREVLVNAEGFPEAQGGQNMMQLKETGGADGFGQLSILIDPNHQDDENKALQRWLKDAAAECLANSDAFKDKYSFFCPQAEELGFTVRDQPIHSIEDPSLTTFKIKFYGKPNTDAKEESIVGVEFFQEGAEGHRPASGKFFMEAYQSKADQEAACNDAYTQCLTGDPTQDSKCLRDLDACLDNAEDGFKPVSDFGEATAIIFHKTDCKQPAVTHSFDEVRIGDSINITDKATGHFIVAEIDAIQQVGDHIRFTIDTVSHSGGIIDGNKCAVEFYDFSLTPNGPDLENYVKKAGDTMTGQLKITGSSKTGPLLLVEPTEAGKSDYIFRVNDKAGNPVFDVHNNGQAFYERVADTDAEVANKKYVDQQITKIQQEEDETNARLYGSPYVFRKDKSPDSLANGEFTYDSDWNWYAHRYDAAGDRIGVSTEKKFSHSGCFKVYKHNGSINLICIMHTYDTCRTGQSDNDHSKWEKDESIYTHTEWLEEGKTYYLSDSFLLP